MLDRILNKKFHIGWVFAFLLAGLAVCVYALTELI